MIETSSDLLRKTFATLVVFGHFRKVFSKCTCGSRINKRILENFLESGRKSSKNRQKRRNVYGYIMNKTMHVAYRYEISLLVFNIWVQLSRVSCVHSWDLTCGDIELNAWSAMHICIILEEMHVELVLFHCIILSYPSCLFRQFPTRSKFTDRTQSLTIFAEWLSGLMDKMAHKLN